jgi:hypothetical protein
MFHSIGRIGSTMTEEGSGTLTSKNETTSDTSKEQHNTPSPSDDNLLACHAPQKQVLDPDVVVNPHQSASTMSSGNNNTCGLQSRQRLEYFGRKMQLVNEGCRREKACRQLQASASTRDHEETDAAIFEIQSSTKATSGLDEKRRLDEALPPRNSTPLHSSGLVLPGPEFTPNGDIHAEYMAGTYIKTIPRDDASRRSAPPLSTFASHSNSTKSDNRASHHDFGTSKSPPCCDGSGAEPLRLLPRSQHHSPRVGRTNSRTQVKSPPPPIPKWIDVGPPASPSKNRQISKRLEENPLPLSELAMIMSRQLTIAIQRGSFGYLEDTHDEE